MDMGVSWELPRDLDKDKIHSIYVTPNPMDVICHYECRVSME